MSYDNQDLTLHQGHLDKKRFHPNCEMCWNEDPKLFPIFASADKRIKQVGELSNTGKNMQLRPPEAIARIDTYMWLKRMKGEKPFENL